MMVVHTRTSCSPRANAIITRSRTPSGIWPWPTTIARAGQQAPQLLRLRLDGLDPVVDVEDLAAAVELAQDGVLDEACRRLRDAGLDGQPVLRRRLDDAHVADPDERQVERARDGRRRQRQHVDLGPELLEALLVGDPEALLLVHDDQAEVAEADVLAQQPVGADDQVDRARREALERRPSARPRARTG